MKQTTNVQRRVKTVCALLGMLVAQSVLLVGTNFADEAVAPAKVTVHWTQLRAVNEQPIAPANSDWTVVAFLGTECPLTRLYGQRLSELARQFTVKDVRFIGINSNPQ